MTTSSWLTKTIVRQMQRFYRLRGLHRQLIDITDRKLIHSSATQATKVKNWAKIIRRQPPRVRIKEMSAFRWPRHSPAITWLIVNPCRSLPKALQSAEGHRWANSAASKPTRWSKVSSRKACRSHRINFTWLMGNSNRTQGTVRKVGIIVTYLHQAAKSRSCHTKR